MSWRKWRLGMVVSFILSALVAGAALTAGAKWQVLVAVFCSACMTHFGSFLKDHPIDKVEFDTELLKKDKTNDQNSGAV